MEPDRIDKIFSELDRQLYNIGDFDVLTINDLIDLIKKLSSDRISNLPNKDEDKYRLEKELRWLKGQMMDKNVSEVHR